MLLPALAVLAFATLTVSPGDGCPTAAAVDAELARLGTRAALDEVGGADVVVDGATLRVHLRDRSGAVLGAREVEAPAGCGDRAQLGAVLISAWTGEWQAAHFPTVIAPAPSPLHAQVGVFGAYVRDGSAGALGAGVLARLGYGRWFLSGIAEGTGARSVSLGPGQAVYSSWRFGPGVGGMTRAGRVIVDGTASALIVRRSVRGDDLKETRAVSRTGLAVDGRARVAWLTQVGQPFVCLSVSRDLSGQEVTLDDLPARATLSPTNVAVGIGFSVEFGKSP